MAFPDHVHTGTAARVMRSIQRRAIALAAMQDGLGKDEAAARVGVSRNMLNRYLRDDWRPGI